MSSNMQKGKLGEEFAVNVLSSMGLFIEQRNFKVLGGEIDIIAIDEDEIAFIEVKTRQENALVNGVDAVDKTKQKRIIKTAKAYLEKYTPELYPRFDIFEITIFDNEQFAVKNYEYIKSAFWEEKF